MKNGASLLNNWPSRTQPFNSISLGLRQPIFSNYYNMNYIQLKLLFTRADVHEEELRLFFVSCLF